MKHACNYQTGPIRRLASKVSDFISDWSYAQHRLYELATAPDRYLLNPDAAPEDYAEFLHRTSGVLHHEPPARSRVSR